MIRMGRTVLFGAAVCLMLGTAVETNAGPIGPGAFSGSATLINFDTLTGGNDINTGEIITNQYAGLGVIFNNPTLLTRANASPLGSGAVTNSKPNVAFIRQGSGISGPNVPPQELIFSVPVTKVGMSFFTSQDADVTLELFDSGNSLLESLDLVGNHVSGFLEGFIGLQANSLVAVARITSHGTGSGASFNFSIDDVRFEGPAATQGVPEPTGFVLLSGIALAGVGRLARARWMRRATA